MSGGLSCECETADRRRHWRVAQRNCNHSKFNGRRYTPSNYSEIVCLVCGRHWRTKAAYVRQLADGLWRMGHWS